MKTDGKRIVAVAQERVHVIGVKGGKMTLRKTLPDRWFATCSSPATGCWYSAVSRIERFEPGFRWPGQQAVLTMYDISNLTDPQLLATLTIDGDVLDARLVGTQVRVATVSRPTSTPRRRSTPQRRHLRASPRTSCGPLWRRTTVDDWVPTYTLQDGAGEQVSRGRLVECADLARPETFSGLDTVAVSSFDMGSALQSRKAVGVIAGGQQIYATDASTYVSTTDWSRDGFSGQDEHAQVRHRPSGRQHLQGIGRGARNPAQPVRDV